jgi:MarR family transcriptional regulator for hemolysin
VNQSEPLGRRLVFTAKVLRDAFEATLATSDGSLATWIVLSALSDLEFVTQASLASHVHLEGATITHHIDRLEAAGLVRRLVDPDDRRARRLELTPAGIELHERLLAAVIELERTAMSGLDDGDLLTLERCLRTIQANLAHSSQPRRRPRPPGTPAPSTPETAPGDEIRRPSG